MRRQCGISRANIPTVLSSGLQVSHSCRKLSGFNRDCFSAVVVLLTPDYYSIALLRQITPISLQTSILGLNPCERPAFIGIMLPRHQRVIVMDAVFFRGFLSGFYSCSEFTFRFVKALKPLVPRSFPAPFQGIF